jgi:hypothetical protein
MHMFIYSSKHFLWAGGSWCWTYFTIPILHEMVAHMIHDTAFLIIENIDYAIL